MESGCKDFLSSVLLMSATDVGLAVNPHVLDGVEVRAKTQKPNQSGTDGA